MGVYEIVYDNWHYTPFIYLTGWIFLRMIKKKPGGIRSSRFAPVAPIIGVSPVSAMVLLG